MEGVEPGTVEPRHIGKERQATGRLETGDEFGKATTVFEQERRLRRRLPYETARHFGKERLPDQGQHGRKARFDRLDQRDGDIVAVNGETLGRDAPCGIDDVRGHCQIGIEQGRGEAGLGVRLHGTDAPSSA